MRILMTFLLALVPLVAAAQSVPRDWQREFPIGDFSRAIIDISEIRSGGPPRDGIPALSDPEMMPQDREETLDARDPVLVLALPGQVARAYPFRYLTWHEIVNDRVGGVPVAVTFCPLCNAAMVFDRRLGDRELTFGVTGRLRFSDMIMYDSQTESWWQQALGQAVVGTLAGAQLEQMMSWTLSWAEFRAEYPQGLVMAEPAAARSYGSNPYVGYDTMNRPFLYNGEDPPFGIHPLERVVRVGNRAWPLERVRAAGRLVEEGVTLTWVEGQASALDTRRIGDGREVGTVRVTDETGAPLVHDMPFAFAFDAFYPDGDWMIGD